ncbi:MAG: tRNA uridine-5-carboxymethylaminomethyl(34) synthesis GTPase MnmE [Mycoplasmoidaceae bacterium]
MRNIASVATPLINSAIHIIRITGPNVFEIINKISSKKILKKNRIIEMTNIIKNNEIIDQVLLMLFVAPNSYTGEDLIEINCHGNLIITNQILDLLLINGCFAAQRGEFTKLAFLNNKLDISQAISINKISTTASELEKKILINNVIGKTKFKLEDWKNKVFDLIGNVEVSIDYPEYDDIKIYNYLDIKNIIKNILNDCKEIINNYLKYKYLFEGINILILGKPNVGKSTFFNWLINKDRSIISDKKGTTRDYINEQLIHNGIKYNFIDTAGIRKISSKIEKTGIQKSIDLIDSASLVLFLVDGSKKSDKEDDYIFQKIINKNYIIFKTKKDLGIIEKIFPGIEISIEENSEIIFEYMREKLNLNEINKDNIFATSKFEYNLLKIIEGDCILILNMLEENISIDIIIEVIKTLYDNIKSLLGLDINYEIIDEIFDNFCLGK